MRPLANCQQGELEGIEKDGVLQFRSITYAKPPVGELRFAAPQPPLPWTGVFDASKFGAMSAQKAGGLSALLGDGALGASEDSLTLNVWTPSCDDAARPVMVWIHGGGFINGSGSTPWYDGTNFVQRGDVVVVTLNYRLGAFGFLWLGDIDSSYRSSGVNGLLDQIAALQWVQDNIANFGGDPNNVTIFGESAGGMSVSTLLTMPAAKGLFHKAIAQSGAGHNTFSTKTASVITEMFFTTAGISSIDELLELDTTTVAELTANVEAQLFADTSRIANDSGISLAMPFQPVVDGNYLPKHPVETFLSGEDHAVPLLTGTNLDEWNLFAMMTPKQLDEDRLRERAKRIFGESENAIATYRKANPQASATDVWNAVMTDGTFRIPALRMVEARQHPSYLYMFTWPSPAFDGIIKSCHALEIPFVFGHLDAPGAEFFLGSERNDDLYALANAMGDCWIAFARTGSPQTADLEWPQWNGENYPTMIFDVQRKLVADPLQEERKLWDGLL